MRKNLVALPVVTVLTYGCVGSVLPASVIVLFDRLESGCVSFGARLCVGGGEKGEDLIFGHRRSRLVTFGHVGGEVDRGKTEKG